MGDDKIDIIIPLFNSIDFFRSCIESVLAYNKPENINIYIIDDCSTETEIADYLADLEGRQIPNLTIIRNEHNYGFVKNANRGMSISNKNDVILLNTDTIVTKEWFKKLRKAAYSGSKIATVTPLTNNATLTSIPIPFTNNQLAEGMSAEDYNKIVQVIEKPGYYEMPTGNGFCMYITRAAIKEVGLFDEQKFGKGYGEEVDFCLRAKKKGYKNIVADDTYIQHVGSASFSIKTRAEKVQKATKIINKEYPKYSWDVFSFAYDNPLKSRCEQVKILEKLYPYKDRLKVMIYKHYEHSTAGTGVYTKQLINSESEDKIFFLIYPVSDEKFALQVYVDKQCILDGFIGGQKDGLNDLCKQLNIDILHINYLTKEWKLSEVEKLDLYKIITIHDYSPFVSNNPFLVKPHTATLDRFAKNLVHYFEYEPSIKEKIVDIYEKFDKVIYLSGYMQEQVSRICDNNKLIDSKTVVSSPETPGFEKVDLKKGGKQGLAYLGSIAEHKGILDYLEIVSDPKVRAKYNPVIVGGADKLPRPLMRNPKLFLTYWLLTRKVGQYKKDDLPDIFQRYNIDTVIIPSVCAETYSYTLSEASTLVDKVLVNDAGALGWRADNEKIATKYENMEQAKDILLNDKFIEPQQLKSKRVKIYDHRVKERRKNDIIVRLKITETEPKGIKSKIRAQFVKIRFAKKLIKIARYCRNEYLGK